MKQIVLSISIAFLLFFNINIASANNSKDYLLNYEDYLVTEATTDKIVPLFDGDKTLKPVNQFDLEINSSDDLSKVAITYFCDVATGYNKYYIAIDKDGNRKRVENQLKFNEYTTILIDMKDLSKITLSSSMITEIELIKKNENIKPEFETDLNITSVVKVNSTTLDIKADINLKNIEDYYYLEPLQIYYFTVDDNILKPFTVNRISQFFDENNKKANFNISYTMPSTSFFTNLENGNNIVHLYALLKYNDEYFYSSIFEIKSLNGELVVEKVKNGDITEPELPEQNITDLEIKQLNFKTSHDKVELFWNLPINENFSHVNIYRGEIKEVANRSIFVPNIASANDSFELVKIFETNGTTFNDLTVQPNSTYVYKLSVENLDGTETDGVIRTIKTKAVPYVNPDLPTIDLKSSFSLGDIATGISSWFSSFWLILAFSISIPLAFYIASRVKLMFID